MKIKNIISLMGQFAVIAGSLLLFLYLHIGLSKYDNISSGGTDDRVWLEPGGLTNEEIEFLFFLSISLIVTGYPLWCYFKEMKNYATWKDFLSLPLYKDIPDCISITQTLLYVASVIYYNLSLPSAILPPALYKENSVVSTFDDCIFLILFAIWPFFLIGVFLHEILDWIERRVKKSDADSVTTDPKVLELYETLNDNTYKTRPWQTEDLGEGMAIVNQVIGEYWKPRFLIDNNSRCAYEFMNKNETLCTVKQEDIDWDSLKSLSQQCITRARSLDYHYPSFVRKYENGVAQVSWQLNPDGMYFMDEDGFGMTDDDEVTIYGFIDRKGKVLIKFRYINDNWKFLDDMRKEAEKLVNL